MSSPRDLESPTGVDHDVRIIVKPNDGAAVDMTSIATTKKLTKKLTTKTTTSSGVFDRLSSSSTATKRAASVKTPKRATKPKDDKEEGWKR